ncbi:hypothetical protein ACTXG5_07185 [Mycobacterium sp. Dal123C01]|uniref:hypothetical protein n=1 Tax=Mycobacterium sp. Dal123C01 TaxID=3457577 RepID=UPI00403E7630
MSRSLMSAEMRDPDSRPRTAAGPWYPPERRHRGYVAYGGRFSADEEASTLHHDVTMSMMAELLA